LRRWCHHRERTGIDTLVCVGCELAAQGSGDGHGDTDTHPNKDSLPGSHAPGIPGAPPIPLVKSACWRWIGQALPYCGRSEGFYVG